MVLGATLSETEEKENMLPAYDKVTKHKELEYSHTAGD